MDKPSGDEIRTDEEAFVTIPGFNSMADFIQAGFQILVDATKSSNKLPCGKSRDFYEACPSFQRIMKEQGDAALNQLSRVLKHAGSKGNVSRRDKEERMEMIVEANDTIFERVGTLLDDIAGIRRNPDAELVAKASKKISGSWNRRSLGEKSFQKMSPVVTAMIQSSKNMEKPQLSFTDKVDNARDSPFVPKIKFKFNLLKPLAILFEDDENGGQYSHPYEFEIEKFSPSDDSVTKSEPVMYQPLEQTPFLHVTTFEQFEEMLGHLRTVDSIAIDLEHHSYRSFQGFTCLMQVSTRERDFIIDTIALRNDMQSLNEVFTNPKVLKVLHGAQSDIQWLQRDLGLYIVNMFDTHIAARHLNYSALSLAYLLNRFCDVQAQKQFQLADWRIRPLPQEMISYAREDTHYLLYIADVLRNDLIDKANGQDNLLRSVFSESNLLCLTRYSKASWHPDDYLNLYHKSKRLFDNRQLSALQQMYDWRDKTARECDENIGYVLPNHMLLHIAETLPREVQGILACCNPVPPLVRQNLTALHYMVRRAREQPLVRPMQEVERQVTRSETYAGALSDDSPLKCPHDLSWMPDFRPDLPVLINSTVTISASSSPLGCAPKVTIFDSVKSSARRINGTSVMTPYQRYKMAKSYADAVSQQAPKQQIEIKKEPEQVEVIKMEAKIEETKEVLPLRKQFEPNERKKKKKMAENEPVDQPKQKKMKKDPSNAPGVWVRNPCAVNLNKTTNSEPAATIATPPVRNRQKGRMQDTPAEKHQSFDYAAVDYGKFQSSSAQQLVHKNKKNKIKHSRKGKKKIKVAI